MIEAAVSCRGPVSPTRVRANVHASGLIAGHVVFPIRNPALRSRRRLHSAIDPRNMTAHTKGRDADHAHARRSSSTTRQSVASAHAQTAHGARTLSGSPQGPTLPTWFSASPVPLHGQEDPKAIRRATPDALEEVVPQLPGRRRWELPLGDAVDLEQVGAEALAGEAGGDSDQVAGASRGPAPRALGAAASSSSRFAGSSFMRGDARRTAGSSRRTVSGRGQCQHRDLGRCADTSRAVRPLRSGRRALQGRAVGGYHRAVRDACRRRRPPRGACACASHSP